MFVLGIGIVVVVAVVAGDFSAPNETASISDAVPQDASQEKKSIRPNEILVETSDEGAGAPAKAGDGLVVHYTGRLADGTVFDSSLERGIPFEFVLGSRSVIPCWDQGLVGVKMGSKLRLTCPPLAAYGEAGVPNVIPPNSVLAFDVEIIGIKPGNAQE